MHALRLFLFLAISTPLVSYSEEEAGEHSQIGELCIQAQDPGECLKSYGFVCHQSRRYDRSLEAYGLGCNLALWDGRSHFVQILYDDGGWTVENQHTYVPEQDEVRTEAEDSALALSNYVREEMKNHSMQSSSSSTGNSEYFSGPLDIEIGTRRQGEQIALRAMCGVVIDGQLSETVLMWMKAECEENVLRSITMLSQPQAAGPFRAAGAAEIEWSSKTTALASSDTALIVEGHYRFPKKHRPCRWMNDCCAGDGSVYLDSCRIPTESELEVVASCLAKGLYSHSDEYYDCLREAGVKTGCDEQADGSRICY